MNNELADLVKALNGPAYQNKLPCHLDLKYPAKYVDFKWIKDLVVHHKCGSAVFYRSNYADPLMSVIYCPNANCNTSFIEADIKKQDLNQYFTILTIQSSDPWPEKLVEVKKDGFYYKTCIPMTNDEVRAYYLKVLEHQRSKIK